MKSPSIPSRALRVATLFPVFAPARQMAGLALAVLLPAMSASAQTAIVGGAIYKTPASFVSGGMISQQYSVRIKASRLTSTTAWQTTGVLWSKLEKTYVEGNPAFKEGDPVKIGNHHIKNRYYDNLWGCSHSYVNFEMNESIDVEVSKKDGTKISVSTKIYPANKVTNINFVDGKVTFTMPRPCNVAVDINGEIATRVQSDSPPAVHTLSIHGNPTLEGKPSATGADVFSVTAGTPPTQSQLDNFKNSTVVTTMYFKPGIHTIGTNFKVYPNKKYYIPGDAIVYGTFNNHNEKAIPSISLPGVAPGDARNIKFFGHGTLSGQGFNHWELDKVNLNADYDKDGMPLAPVVTVMQTDKNSNPINSIYKEQQRISYRKRPIDLTYCSNVKVQGLVIADPANNSMHLFNTKLESDNSNEVSWVKIFAWRVNSDGGGINDSSRVSNCFYRVQDDGFYPKGVALSDNVLWTDANGVPLRLSHLDQLKTEAMLKLFKTDILRVENIDVIFRRNLSWSKSGAIQLPKDNTTRDKKFVFSNINISDPNPSKPPIRIEQGSGSLSNIRFENVTIEAMPGAPNDKNIITADADGTINIAFHNLVIGGEVVTSINYEKYFTTSPTTTLNFTNNLLPRKSSDTTQNWIVTGSGAANAGLAIDDDRVSRWFTNAPQAPGQYFQVDMKSVKTFDRIMLNTVAAKDDYPRGYKVSVSTNLNDWREVATGSGAGAVTMISFPPQTARYIRVDQTGTTPFYWWSIGDFNVFESEALDRTGWAAAGYYPTDKSPSYAPFALDGRLDTRWNTQSPQSISSQQYFQVNMLSPRTFSQISLDSGAAPGDYPRGYAIFVSADGVSWGNPVAVGNGYGPVTSISFPQQTAQYIRVCQTGSASWNRWSIYEFKVFETNSPKAFDRVGWTSAGSLNSVNPAFALDGNPRTCWDTQAVQTAAQQYFEVDMKAAKTFDRIALDSGASLEDYPRGYTVYVSSDGLSWGDAPVAMGYGYISATPINFPQQTARYIRVYQTGIASWNWWSVYEFNVYKPQ
jgi:hypothetical protein